MFPIHYILKFIRLFHKSFEILFRDVLDNCAKSQGELIWLDFCTNCLFSKRLNNHNEVFIKITIYLFIDILNSIARQLVIRFEEALKLQLSALFSFSFNYFYSRYVSSFLYVLERIRRMPMNFAAHSMLV